MAIFFAVGDTVEHFSIQSISKVYALTIALKFIGEDKLLNRVGKEPSGNSFNSLVQLEYENGIPRNPFINAGALVVTDIIYAHSGDAAKTILEFVRERSNSVEVDFDSDVAASEKETGYRNADLANFLKTMETLTIR